MFFWIWAAALLGALALFLRERYSRFSRYGVKHFAPVPLLGNMTRVMLRIDHFADYMDQTYKAFRDERFTGKFEFLYPTVVIHDLNLIKKITVKDFEYFLDHRIFIDKTCDPLFGRNVLSLRGQEWKDMRSTLSPAFTSSKIRVMVPFMVEAGDQMVKALKNKIQESGVGYIDVDVKVLTSRYATDVIASCAFGLKVDSQTDEQNQFYGQAKEALTFGFRQVLVFLGFTSFPWIMKTLKISLFSEKTSNFFRSLVTETMQNREVHNIIRPDMIHLLMEAKKGKLLHEDKTTADADAGFATVEESAVGKKEVNRVWSDDDLIAQAVIFFIAGFETVSAAMSFLLHELALNPEVQERLVHEIRHNDAKNGGKFDYNSVQQMTYLDMVVSELLRLWSPGVTTDRLCNKDYNLGKPNDKATEDYILRKGEGVNIPVWSIHRDPKYFPNPLKFDPERFSEENRHNIKPFSYLPFGLGPRNCIGSRFALCEMKVMAYQLRRSSRCVPALRLSSMPNSPAKHSTLRSRGDSGLGLKLGVDLTFIFKKTLLIQELPSIFVL